MKLIAVALLVMGAFVVGRTASRASAAAGVEYLRSAANERLKLPFSDAVRVGDLLFVSGQIGAEPGAMRLVEGGIKAEAQRTMENIRAVLEANGSSMNKVVKCTVFLADMGEWGEFNSVYTTFFPENLPARSAFGASGLALGARVEVECIAAA